MRYWPVIPALIIGFWLSYQDFKTNKIHKYLSLLYVFSCILIRRDFCPWPIIIFAIIGVFSYLILATQAFGAGDYIIIFGSSFIVSQDLWPVFITLTGFFGLCTSVLFRGKRTIPFIPSIILSTFCLLLFELLY